MLFERARDQRPCGAEVDFAVFGEEGREGGFFGEGSTEVVFGLEGFDLGSGISEDDVSRECGGGYRERNGDSESGMSLELSSFNSRESMRCLPSTYQCHQYPMACPFCTLKALWWLYSCMALSSSEKLEKLFDVLAASENRTVTCGRISLAS